MSTPLQLRTGEVREDVARHFFQTSNRLSTHWLQGKLCYSRAVTGKIRDVWRWHAKYFRMHSGRRPRRRGKDHDASLTASVPRAIPPSGVGEDSLDCSGVTFYRHYRCRADEGQATSEPVHKPPHERPFAEKNTVVPQVVRPKGETVA